jgi:septum formation topological specificity factor MinE
VTDWQVVFLGVIALALVAMAGAQLYMGLTVARTSRQVTDTMESLRRDVAPLIVKATKVTDDAARVTELAVLQAERVDRMVANVAMRVDDTLSVVQSSVVEPVRQGAAVVAGIRAMIGAFRDRQARPQAHRDDEDPLFVG